MKKRGLKAVLIAGACALAVGTPAITAYADPESPADDAKAGIMTALNGYADAYLDENLSLALSYFSDRPTTTVMGAQSTELAIGKPRIEQALSNAFAQLPPEQDPVAIRYRVLSIDSSGGTGWVTTFVDIDVPAADGHGVDTVTVRHSSTLERNDQANGRWQFVQFHNSVPIDGFPEPGDAGTR